MPKISEEQLGNWFTYHPPRDDAQLEAYVQIRNAGFQLARTIVLKCPPSADTTAAVRKVREAVMTANAAIACHVEEEPQGHQEPRSDYRHS